MSMYKILLISVALLTACSTESPVVDGTFTPNFVKGITTDIYGDPIVYADISIKKTAVTDTGEVVLAEHFTVSDSVGMYTFENIEEGDWHIVAENDSLISVKQVHIREDEDCFAGASLASKKKTIRGRIFGKRGIAAFIPGLGKNVQIDSDNIYTLKNIPASTQRVVFMSGKISNVLRCNINTEKDTVYVKDVGFSSGGVSSQEVEVPFIAVEAAYNTKQIVYSEQQKPQWYANKDFTGVEYENEPKPEAIVYNFTGEYDSLWSNPLNWYSGKVPDSDDSAAILYGVCYADSISNTNAVMITGKALFRPTNSSFTKIIGEKGIIVPDVNVIIDEINVLDTLTYVAEENTVHSFKGEFTGSGVFYKNGWGELSIFKPSNSFTGISILVIGKMRGKTRGCLGTSKLFVWSYGVFDLEGRDILADFSEIHLETGESVSAQIEMDQNSEAKNVYIGGEKLLPGAYSSVEYPNTINDNGMILIVTE